MLVTIEQVSKDLYLLLFLIWGRICLMCPPLMGDPVYDRLVMNEEGNVREQFHSGTIWYLNNVIPYTSSMMLWKCHGVPCVKEWWCHNRSLALSEIHKLRNILQKCLINSPQIVKVTNIRDKLSDFKNQRTQKSQDHLKFKCCPDLNNKS